METRSTRKKQQKTDRAAPAPATAAPSFDAFILALQHATLRDDQASICRLLCSSNATAATVASACRGLICLNLDTPGPDEAHNRDAIARAGAEAYLAAQTAWLRRNALLLRELTCCYRWITGYRPLPHSMGASIPQYSQALPAVLEVLPAAQHLTSLHAGVNMRGFDRPADVRRTASRLAAITSLKCLDLSIDSAEATGGPAALLSGLRGLTQLTHCQLRVSGMGPGFLHISSAGLSHLPASLISLRLAVHLGLQSEMAQIMLEEAGAAEYFAMGKDQGGKGIDEFDDYPSAPQPPLLLGHLTNLKELAPHPEPFMYEGLGIRAGDVLPSGLTSLELEADNRSLGGLLSGPLSAPTVAPLTPLKQLQVLKIDFTKATAAQLHELAAALTPPHGLLRDVSLGYLHPAQANAAAAAWSRLPITGLSIVTEGSEGYKLPNSSEKLSVDTVRALAGLTLLTRLVTRLHNHNDWSRNPIDCAATAQQLADSLTCLTRLQELSWSGSLKPPEGQGSESSPAEGSESSPAEIVSTAVAALPNLQTLGLKRLNTVASIIAAAPGASQVTALRLSGLADADVAQLAATMKGLRHLDLSGCRGVTDASLPALGGLAECQLKVLDMYDTGASRTAIEALPALNSRCQTRKPYN